MPHPPRLFPSDVELGKRDDDHRPRSNRRLASVRLHYLGFLRRSYKRVALGLILLVVLYHFLKNIPTDLGPYNPQPNSDHQSTVQRNNRLSNSQTTRPKNTDGKAQSGAAESNVSEAQEEHSYNGAIKFYQLASSLTVVAKNTRGGGLNTGHVLFAASQFKSAATLLPLACEMATFKRNHVHFAFMGRDGISLDLLKEVNGIQSGCAVWFHDSRPDYLLQSSDYRMEVSSSAALGHINDYVRPRALIIDNSGTEDLWFLKAMRDRASILDKALIELPGDVEQSLRYITRLDSSSLMFWNKISIDIIVHAQPAASASLLRLLSSLSKADYLKSAPPRLTIELPHKAEEPTKKFLEDFRWPPSDHPLEGNANQLNLRHRISESSLTEEENSIRFLESFWPTKPITSHLLVLSPQVELSPLYFQYLKYLILEHRYSAEWASDRKLMGISLDLPSTYLNDTTGFSLPTNAGKGGLKSAAAISFLWEAPNSNAALYFGEMWTELHSFLSHSLTSQHKLPAPTALSTKEVSKTYPSWLESVLKLVRTRGYYFLYSTLANEMALATVHNELYQPPEEFSPSQDAKEQPPGPLSSTDFTVDPAHHLSLQHVEKPLASKSLLKLLPSDGVLSALADMPLLSWDGKEVSRKELDEAASDYSQVFRREIGGCSTLDGHKTVVNGSADDLFCLDDA